MRIVKRSIFTLVILLIGMSSTFAANAPKQSKEELRKEVSQLLENPLLEGNEYEVAKVRFFVNNDMEIIVIDVNSDSPSLEYMVKSRLHHKKVHSVGEGDLYTLFNLEVTFKQTGDL
jgi:hypothetical protein